MALILNNQSLADIRVITRSATLDDFSGHFFRIFEIIIFCFVVAICDLVHDMEATNDLPQVLTASGNLF